MLDPFIVNPLNMNIYLQEELIKQQLNEEIKPSKVGSYEHLRLQKETPAHYLALWATMKSLLMTISSSSVQSVILGRLWISARRNRIASK
ncbi:hypothetical protein M514_12806 [Trichuris suis]|uniref:Uncharacterized protein n=1 Tax=Trichuris suis TaxID=68888 RepID=A0A085N3F7_9BILA|nr:hypothetical protein M514_12806 [Trichuris suis]